MIGMAVSTKNKIQHEGDALEQQAPTFFAPRTNSMEENFSMHWWGGGGEGAHKEDQTLNFQKRERGGRSGE